MLPVGHNRIWNQLRDIRTTIRDNRFRILKYVYVEYVTWIIDIIQSFHDGKLWGWLLSIKKELSNRLSHWDFC